MSDESPDPTKAEADTGFSPGEKAIGVWAASKHPFISSVVADHMLDTETSPTRRQQLTNLRNGAMAWWIVGVVAALIGIVIIASVASSHGLSGDCKGGIDKMDPMNTTFESSDNKHWTATYPCYGGGSTTIPVPRKDVPGGG